LISIVQLGTVDYATALHLQESLVELRKAGTIGDTLLLLEHSPVITLGRNAKRDHLLAQDELLRHKQVEVFECDRGGDVTFHGPGQLVGYPIFDLRGFQQRLGAVEFVRRLEEVLIRSCADFGIAATRILGMTGVWTAPRKLANEGVSSTRVGTGVLACPGGSQNRTEAKIAAIGVHISRGVTSHGFALNVNTDLDYFDLIVPCGLSGKGVTSIAKETGSVPLDEVAQSVASHFGKVFGTDVNWVDTLDALLGRTVGVPVRPPAEVRQLHGEEEVFLA